MMVDCRWAVPHVLSPKDNAVEQGSSKGMDDTLMLCVNNAIHNHDPNREGSDGSSCLKPRINHISPKPSHVKPKPAGRSGSAIIRLDLYGLWLSSQAVATLVQNTQYK